MSSFYMEVPSKFNSYIPGEENLKTYFRSMEEEEILLMEPGTKFESDELPVQQFEVGELPLSTRILLKASELIKTPLETLQIVWPIPVSLGASAAIIGTCYSLCAPSGLIAPGIVIAAAGIATTVRATLADSSQNMKMVTAVTGAATFVLGMLSISLVPATVGPHISC